MSTVPILPFDPASVPRADEARVEERAAVSRRWSAIVGRLSPRAGLGTAPE